MTAAPNILDRIDEYAKTKPGLAALLREEKALLDTYAYGETKPGADQEDSEDLA